MDPTGNGAPGPNATITNWVIDVNSSGTLAFVATVSDGSVIAWSATRHLSNPSTITQLEGSTTAADLDGVFLTAEIDQVPGDPSRCPISYDWELHALEPESISGTFDVCP